MQFHRVYFAPRKFEMERFRNTAQHPVRSKSVKELVYDERLLHEEYREAEAHKVMLSWQLWDPVKLTSYPERCLEGGLEHYSKTLKSRFIYGTIRRIVMHYLLA